MTATAGPDAAHAREPREDDPREADRRAAPADLVRRHESRLRRWLLVLGAGAGAECDDLLQETFLVLLQRDFVERDERATAAFLRRTAKHLFLRRHRGRLPQVEAAEAVWREECSDDDGDGYVAALRECLDRLGARARRIVEASYAEGLGRPARSPPRWRRAPACACCGSAPPRRGRA